MINLIMTNGEQRENVVTDAVKKLKRDGYKLIETPIYVITKNRWEDWNGEYDYIGKNIAIDKEDNENNINKIATLLKGYGSNIVYNGNIQQYLSEYE